MSYCDLSKVILCYYIYNRIKSVLYGRKTLYLVLAIVIISVFTLSIAYAVLSTTLNIIGSTEITASNWDIHLDNVQLNSQSATTTAPTITNSTTSNKFKITTDVNVQNGKKGGTITGEDEQPFETVKASESNTKEITANENHLCFFKKFCFIKW